MNYVKILVRKSAELRELFNTYQRVIFLNSIKHSDSEDYQSLLYFFSETKIGKFYCKGFGSQVVTIIYASNYVVTIFIKQKH